MLFAEYRKSFLKFSCVDEWMKSDYDRYKIVSEKKCIFPEEALMESEQCTQLLHIQSMASYAYLVEEGMVELAVYLYFKLPETIKSQKLPSTGSENQFLDALLFRQDKS